MSSCTEYREVHGGMGYGRSEPDAEGERILEYALAFDLLLGNAISSRTSLEMQPHRLHPFSQSNAQTCHRCESYSWGGSSSATSASCM